MIALIHAKGVPPGFLAFVLTATLALIGMAWYAIRKEK
jgi:hypothetical protein